MRETKQQLNLSKPITAYFEADKLDGEAISKCFTANAVVKDEGNTHKGQAAIKKWKDDVSAKFVYTTQPFSCESENGRTVVTAHVAGNFPGSPIDLRFFFKLEGDKISALEIIPKE